MSVPGLLVLAVVAGLVAGCGGSAGDEADGGASGPLAAAAKPDSDDFPSVAARQTFEDFVDGLDAQPATLRMATSAYTTGHSRIAFAVMRDGRPVYGPTVLYASPIASQAREVAGPLPAAADTLGEAGDQRGGNALAAIYDASAVDLHHGGRYALLTLTAVDGGLIAARGEIEVVARARDPLPAVGKPLDGARPPASVAGKPVALVFDGETGCRRRVCASLAGQAERLESDYGDRVAFVDASGQLRRRLGLPAGPWLLTLDSAGRLVARMEGAVGLESFERALQAAIARSPDA